MRTVTVLAGAALLGGLVVARADDDDEAALRRDVERLTKQLEARVERAREAQRGTRLEQRIYSVGGLPAPVEQQELVPANLEPSDAATRLVRERVSDAGIEVDSLIELLRTTCEPNSWDELEGAAIAVRNDRLIVNTLPRVHDVIGKTLKLAHEAVLARVAVEVFVVPVAPGASADLRERPRELDDALAARLLEGAGVERVRIVCLDGQRCAQRVGRDRRHAAGSDGEHAVFEGLGVEVRPLLDGKGGALLQYRVERTAYGAVREAPDEKELLELPELAVARAYGALWAPLGRVVVLGGCTSGEDARVFLARARRPE